MIEQRDLRHNWHPCMQMKDFETITPLVVASARGSKIRLQDGRELIDAISSWWCKSLGHQHPRLREALKKQADLFEHVIFANTTNESIVTLSEQLATLMPPLNKIMYASDGSSAVEMAMKMSVHARQILGESRTTFLTLENSYHGETIGALSVSDVGLYREPYVSLLFPTEIIKHVPYVHNQQEALWHHCEKEWQIIEKQLLLHAKTATAIIVEPLVQGAGGMKIYSQDFLRRLRAFTKEHHIHLIIDEIMTGFGRTGKMLASEHAEVTADFLCIGKGMTSGWLPMSAVLTSQSIYDLFYDDYDTYKAFLHSHTFSGNALAASIACEVMNIMREENICERAVLIGARMHELMQEIATQTKKLTNVRHLGAIVAADLVNKENIPRLGFKVAQKAISEGALIRPLGNTLYWLPPLVIEMDELDELARITRCVL